MFGIVVKILVILLLILLVIVLGGLAYKFLFNDNKEKTTTSQPTQQVVKEIQKPTPKQIEEPKKSDANNDIKNQIQEKVQNSASGLKKEEIALIVQSVLAQMKQEKVSKPVKKTPVATEQDGDNIDNLSNLLDNTSSESKSPPSDNADISNEEISNEDSELLNSLQSISVDSVDKSAVDTTKLEKLNANKQIKENNKKEDTFNKVIVQNQTTTSEDDLSKLYNQLNQIMKKDKEKTKDKKFVKKLMKETKVRANEMRIITVRKGDTLSLIAKRAYGNPMMYNKIFEANPDLITNPNRIFPGQRLRVPK